MKLYLILVCFAACIGGFLFGFDTSVISGVIEFIQTPQVFNLNEIQKGWAETKGKSLEQIEKELVGF